MKTPSTNEEYENSPLLKAITILLIACLFFGNIAVADGTKEIFSDLGLYTGEPAGSYCVDLYQWSYYGPDAAKIDANFQAAPGGAIEGTKVLRVEATNRWAGCGVFFLNCNDATVTDSDFSDYAGGHLRFFLRSTNQVTVEVEFVTLSGLINKAGTNITSTSNVWREIVVPLDSLRPTINLRRIRGPFLITIPDSISRKVVFVDHVRWTKPVDRLVLFPPDMTMSPTEHRQSALEGRSATDEPILLYGSFTVPTNVGVVNPAAPALAMSSVFTASSESGTLTATARIGAGPSDFLSVTSIVEISRDQRYRDLRFDLDAPPPADLPYDLFLFNGGGAAQPTLVAETTDVAEGQFSWKMTIDHAIDTAYSGVAIANGVASSSDSDTRDLSEFFDGVVRSQFKGDPQLEGKLMVGIRSGNVPPGLQYSQVPLSTYVSCDGQWHQFTIPLKVFAGPRPWADLARIKDFFIITAIGDTGGPATFLFDDLRWLAISPRLTLIERLSGNAFRLGVTNTPGVRHTILVSSNLVTWTPIYTNVPNSSSFEFLHTNVPSAKQLFYQARME